MRLSADATPCFTNLPRENDLGDGGADELDAMDYRRRLIYGSVNFVIRSFREVGLRDRGDTYYRAEQK